jgi:cytidyltransferase-like protein
MDEVRAAGAHLVVPDDAPPDLRRATGDVGVPLVVVSRSEREGFPVPRCQPPPAGSPRVVVTGCYDWLHSGHVRFFMDAAAVGALYVVVGSDRNVSLLKGPGHPLLGEAERRYMVGAMRSVHCAVISSGSGWMDAEPEIDWIRPSHYVVNEDGDQPEKRAFCEQRGIRYVILQRVPQVGLPARSSTELRGF